MTGQQHFGPKDISQVDTTDALLDFGALRIPIVTGMELAPLVNASQEIEALQLVIGTAKMQLAVFAAPKTSDLWPSVVEQIVTGLETDGYRVVVAKNGRSVFASAEDKEPLLIVGYSGKRWLVRTIFVGKAATDDQHRDPLINFLQQVVVVRGNDPMPPGGALPLILPRELQEQMVTAQQ